MTFAKLVLAGVIQSDLRHDEIFFSVIQPFGLTGSIGQKHKDQKSNHHGRNAFKQEQPFPTAQAANALHVLHDGARDWRTNDVGDGNRRHEQRDHFGSA